MTEETTARAPGTSAGRLVARAGELRELIREQAAEAEELGHYPPVVHEAFRAAGFYDMLTPKLYGGLEVDLPTFAEVIMEVGRGDPGTSWCLCLGQGHALSAATYWPQKAQEEVFANDRGYFRASHSAAPAGTAKRVDGGWLINAKSRYHSGVPYASHAIVSVLVLDDDAAPGGPPAGGPPAGGPPAGGPPAGGPDGPVVPPNLLQVLIPESQFTILDDWGGDKVFGMRSSGSNTVVVDNQVVPEYYGIPVELVAKSATSPGLRLHGNPMYLGAASMAFAGLELAVCVVGAARAALDEYERLARERPATLPGAGLRYRDPFHQLDFGVATIKADSAETIVLHVAETIHRWSREMVDGGRQITTEMDIGLECRLMEARELAGEAVDILFRSAGTSASGRGQRMQRYLRDVSMYRTHFAGQYNASAQRYGAALFGESQLFR